MANIRPKPLARNQIPAAWRAVAGAARLYPTSGCRTQGPGADPPQDLVVFVRSQDGLCGMEGLEALVCQP